MKNLLAILLVAVTFTATAQQKTMKKDAMQHAVVKTVALEQTKGEFTQKQITLSEGTYVFNITNNAVGHDVGFVLTPKGKTDAKYHLKNAYVTAPVASNTTGTSKTVTLEKGEYVYFCPLNPTPEYTLIVK